MAVAAPRERGNREDGANRAGRADRGAEATLPAIDARHLHRIALEAFRLGNRGRLKLCEILRALHESRQYQELGYPSIEAYAGRFFRFGRTQTYEALRVVRALDGLGACREAFLEGRIDWSSLREITRVAGPGSEREWLAFAARHNNVELRAEVRDAAEKGRDRPRDERYGLPNLQVNLVLRLTRSEHELARKALGRLVPEISERLGGREVGLKETFLFLMNRILGHGVEGALGGGGGTPAAAGGKDGAARTVVYHYCPECRRGKMATEGGMVQVAPQEIERIEGEARREGLDAPTPPPLRRKVLLRDGLRCSNPWCRHPADHCHHIVERSRGGRTALWNESALCATCHALVHAGLLRIERDPEGGIRWSARADSIGVDLAGERERADAPPPIVIHAAPAEGGGTAATESQSTRADSGPEGWSYLAGGLVRLGMRKREARQWIARAVERLSQGCAPLTEERILSEALRSRGATG